ncbi:MAG: hypothetical protein HYW48_06550 [Deltaproteobacteria bacterium]|nr:hypothetical protein [Deltaproteobacteria bacterium]
MKIKRILSIFLLTMGLSLYNASASAQGGGRSAKVFVVCWGGAVLGLTFVGLSNSLESADAESQLGHLKDELEKKTTCTNQPCTSAVAKIAASTTNAKNWASNSWWVGLLAFLAGPTAGGAAIVYGLPAAEAAAGLAEGFTLPRILLVPAGVFGGLTLFQGASSIMRWYYVGNLDVPNHPSNLTPFISNSSLTNKEKVFTIVSTSSSALILGGIAALLIVRNQRRPAIVAPIGGGV